MFEKYLKKKIGTLKIKINAFATIKSYLTRKGARSIIAVSLFASKGYL